jgi:hypothetical protein
LTHFSGQRDITFNGPNLDGIVAAEVRAGLA